MTHLSNLNLTGQGGADGPSLLLGIGTAASWGMIKGFLDTDFVFAPQLAATVALGGVAATVLLGLIGATRTLGRKPGPVLREEST